jgi:hypothetical protein
MFMKQYNYKPRSNSTSSQGSQSGSPPKEESKPATQKPASVSEAAGAVSAGIAGRRRVSYPNQSPSRAKWHYADDG